MKSKPSDDKPYGKLSRIADFLPPPSELLPKEDLVKITLAVDETTVKFFKSAARLSKTKYQKMMREVLKRYAAKHQRSA